MHNLQGHGGMDEDLCGQDHHEGHGILSLSLFFLLINMNFRVSMHVS